MSFDQLSSMESGNGGGSRRQDGGAYSDDPEFSRNAQRLMNKLFHLQGNISKLRSDIGLLGTKRDNPRLRERVAGSLEETTAEFKEVGEGVKQIQAREDVTPTQKYSQQKLSREFKAALAEFQSLQRTAIDKQRASVSAAKAAHEQEHAGESSYTEGQVGEQQMLLERQEVHLAAQDEVDFQDALIVEREEEIRHIEEGVQDLNVLFHQVAQIVGEQGEQINYIDENVTNVRDDTRGADVELRSAARYQKNARTKACCLLLVIAVIVTIVLLAVLLG